MIISGPGSTCRTYTKGPFLLALFRPAAGHLGGNCEFGGRPAVAALFGSRVVGVGGGGGSYPGLDAQIESGVSLRLLETGSRDGQMPGLGSQSQGAAILALGVLRARQRTS